MTLPKGWTTTTLGEVLPLTYGKALPKLLRTTGTVPVYGSSGVVGANSTALTRGPALVVGRKGNVGEAHLSMRPCWPIDTVYFAEGSLSTNLRFFYYLVGFQDLRRLDRSTAVPGLSRDDYDRVEIPLPPQPEQQRIVEAIDSYLTRLDDALASLERVRAKLKAYRASVLKAAVEGRLVPTEAAIARTEKRDYESAVVLLARILKGRRRRWEEAELAKLKAAGKTPKDDKWKAKYKEPAAPDTSTLPRLPEGWRWATVEGISTKVVDGVHKKPDYVSSGVPFVTVKNLTAGAGIDFENLKHITAKDHETFIARANPERGDLLISKDGTLGVIRAVRTDMVFSIFVSVAMVKPVLISMSDYLELALSSPSVQVQMVPKGSGLQHIHLEDLRRDCVPIPPASEQTRILEAAQRHMSVVDWVEETVACNLARLSRLRQVVLKWAFEGKLVDQDPTDEPAERLLDRIRAERAVVTPTKKSRGRTAKEAA